MADAFRQLFALLQGDDTVFPVKALLTDSVGGLKKAIFDDRSRAILTKHPGINAADIVLYKVSHLR
jgi:hypothetical protein